MFQYKKIQKNNNNIDNQFYLKVNIDLINVPVQNSITILIHWKSVTIIIIPPT